MVRMTSAIIDASVLATPPPGSGDEAIRRYVASLSGWRGVVSDGLLKVYINRRASQVLSDIGRFPDIPTLKQVLRLAGTDSPYDPITVHGVAAYLAGRALSFEDEFEIEGVLSSDEVISPDVCANLDDEKLKQELLQNLVVLAVLRSADDLCGLSLMLDCASDISEVSVEARIEDVEHSRNDIQVAPSMLISAEVAAFGDFRRLLLTMLASEIFQDSLDEKSLLSSLKVKLFQIRSESGNKPKWDKLPYNPLGHGFTETAKGYVKAGKEVDKLLRGLAETYDGIAVHKSHKLRTDKKGGSPQQIRGADGAKGMRRPIDAACHLHYWERPDNRIEFANVTTKHDDFSMIS